MPAKKSKGKAKAKKKQRKEKQVPEENTLFINTKEKTLNLQKYVAESYGRVYDLRVRAQYLRELIADTRVEIETLRQNNEEYHESTKSRIEARGALMAEARRRLANETVQAEEQRQKEIEVIEKSMKQLEMEKMGQEAKLDRLKIMLKDAEPLRLQKEKQEGLIKQLNGILKTSKLEQDEELNKLKSNFVRERRELQAKYTSDVSAVKKAADKIVGPCIESQLNQIAQLNIHLHQQLYQVTLHQKKTAAAKTEISQAQELAERQVTFWEGTDGPNKQTFSKMVRKCLSKV